MMPYIVGKDPETGEVIIGDIRGHEFFLRGSSMAEEKIRQLVYAANMWNHIEFPLDQNQ